MEIFRTLTEVSAFVAPDGAHIQELVGRSNGFTSHSLAVIVHPARTASVEHHHTVADEVYFVQAGRGHIRVDEETRAVGPGDVVVIRPGQRHKVWNDGPDDLALLVTCAPAYAVEEVIWDEGKL